MNEFLRKLFSSDFMPHGYCYLWKPEIVWLHAASDGAIALSYLFIPLALVYFVRKRRDLPFHWVFFMFGVFILGCGATHAMEIWTLWHGTYRLAGVIKAITAGGPLAAPRPAGPPSSRAFALSPPLATTRRQPRAGTGDRRAHSCGKSATARARRVGIASSGANTGARQRQFAA